METRDYKKEYENLLEMYCKLDRKYDSLSEIKDSLIIENRKLKEENESLKYEVKSDYNRIRVAELQKILGKYEGEFKYKYIYLNEENKCLKQKISEKDLENENLNKVINELKLEIEFLKEDEKLYKQINRSLQKENESIKNDFDKLNRLITDTSESLIPEKIIKDKNIIKLRVSILESIEKASCILTDENISLYGKIEVCNMLPKMIREYRSLTSLIPLLPNMDKLDKEKSYKKFTNSNELFNELIDNIYVSEMVQ